MITDMPQDPSMRSIVLGAWLRELRDAAKLTTSQVADAVGGSQSQISRQETARITATADDVAALLDLYGATSEARAVLMDLVRSQHRRGWWADAAVWGRDPYLVLEEIARRIRTWQPQVVPGLLQTPAYAHAVIQAGNESLPSSEIEDLVKARMARKPLLERATPPQLDAIVDESVFRRGLSDLAVMLPQLRTLLDLPGHVSLRVLPLATAWHSGTDGSLTVLEFGEGLSPKPRIESAGGALYIESARGVAHCEHVWQALDAAALSREDSRAWLVDLLEEHQ